MTFKVPVERFFNAYKNVCMAMKTKHNCKDIVNIQRIVEEECNLKSYAISEGYETVHYFEFPSEKHFMIFFLKWS
jgi:hypothetical protein